MRWIGGNFVSDKPEYAYVYSGKLPIRWIGNWRRDKWCPSATAVLPSV